MPSNHASKNHNNSSSLESQECRLLRTELSSLGVSIKSDEIEQILFAAKRRWNRFDLFCEGETFESRLLKWLLNFREADRKTAMDIVRNIAFISYKELRSLAIFAFKRCSAAISASMVSTPRIPWNAYLDKESETLREAISRSLFIAASDDVLFDFFRRNAQGDNNRLTRDNFVEYYKLDREERHDLSPHDRVFILDQLSGSGTSAIRKVNGQWKGKLPTFARLWPEDVATRDVYYVPYLATPIAINNLRNRIQSWSSEGGPSVTLLPIQILPVSRALDPKNTGQIDPSAPVSRLCEKYYDLFVPDTHIEIGGSAVYGYGGAGLTVVLNTNVPNNSIPLIWHSDNDWFPLFPRVKHHRLKA